MESPTIVPLNRADQIDFVSRELPSAAGLFARLLLRQLDGELSRTELGLLNTLSSGPRRITELAGLEGLAQPTMTSLVKQLEQQGLVRRERQADDGRVVLVQLTDEGAVALEEYLTRVRELLGSHLAEIPDDEVEALAAATDALARLVALLQQRHTANARSFRGSQRGTLT
ncbi:MAG TPA: MarR family transcriptional regulator [Solirubrobacteraceae bacterium]|jgi:DNA-binding MarR family transcriptional regulator|nr:MarR family transcriptional regulator [Solirubrobacteraceae bacterium]